MVFLAGYQQWPGMDVPIPFGRNTAVAEIWKTAGRTFANQDTNHLMAFVRQLLTERKCLSQMSPAFTLYDKQYFHITSA